MTRPTTRQRDLATARALLKSLGLCHLGGDGSEVYENDQVEAVAFALGEARQDEWEAWFNDHDLALRVKEAEADLKVAHEELARLRGRVRLEDHLAVLDDLQALKAAQEGLELKYRTKLWAAHAHPFAARYGDDGEMQCNAAPACDFKRAPLIECERHCYEAARAAEGKQ